MEAIRAEKVVKSYGTTRALNGVSLEIEPGELFFLLGASGCGKSTLLRCIAGLETPNEGGIFFGNRDVTKMPPHQREAAMVFQSYALWPHLSVMKNISFGLEERKVPKAEIERRVEEALAMVKLEGYGPRGIDAMSGGQQQRVALARALVVRPKCLLLDEPLSNLDAQLRIEMRREIRRIVKEFGLTAVYVTHDQEEALAMADRMAILAGGVIEQVGTPADVYRNPHTSYVAAFIGETNLLEARITALDPVTVEVGNFSLQGRITKVGWQPALEQKVLLSIRPESLRIEEGGIIPAQVVEKVYLGSCIQYWVETPCGKIQVVEMNPHRLYEPEDALRLSVDAMDVVILAH